MMPDGVIYIVDDDDRATKAAQALMTSMGVPSRGYSSAEAFLESYDGQRPACLVTDVRMLGMSGLELQDRLQQLGVTISVVVLTAFASAPVAVRAMRKGALTLLEKPCDDDELWSAVREGLLEDQRRYQQEQRRLEIVAKAATLTPKEREVLEGIVQGDANKVVANKLGVSVRTVEIHRRKVFEKMEADSVAELVRMTLAIGDSASLS